jgi:cytochrome d ubiquinol oxidase subunit II
MTAAAATGALFALWRGRYALARGFATAQVTLILWGWGLAQYPFIVEPDLTFQNAAAPPRVLGLLIGALFLGAIPLSLALVFLFRVFKFRSPPA